MSNKWERRDVKRVKRSSKPRSNRKALQQIVQGHNKRLTGLESYDKVEE